MAPIASMLPSSLYTQGGLPTSFASGPLGQCTDVHAGPSSSLLSASASTLAQKFRQGCGISAPAAGGGNSITIPAPAEGKKKIALYSPEFYRACTIGKHRHEDRSDACLILFRHSPWKADASDLLAMSWVSACFQLCIV